MFQLFDYTVPALFLLPVEMIAAILRCLDSESLLNAVITSKYMLRICKGDSVLRERVKEHFQKERELEERAAIDPRIGISVLRSGPVRMFGCNGEKTVIVEKSIKPRLPAQQELKAKPFTVTVEGNQHNGGGKLRVPRKTRPAPYKSLRC